MWEYPRPSLEIRAPQPMGRSKYHAYEIEEHKKRRDGALFDWHAPIRLLRVAISGASNIARYSSLCNAILATHVQRSIGNDPPSLTPAEAANLPKPVGYCRPSCQECRELNEFLTDDNQAEKTFRIATPQRRHMENMLMNAMTAGGTPAWEFSTIKSGSPYGLLVRKYQGISLQKFGDWNSRCTIARSEISQIAPEHVLRSIIGDAQYIAIMQRLTPIHPQQFQQYYQRPSGLQERNMSAMNYGAPPPQEGPVAKRRRVETIDRT